MLHVTFSVRYKGDTRTSPSLTGSHIDHVIGPFGLLSQKARVVVTNSVNHIKDYDEIILIRRGIILESGTYDDILKQPSSELCKLMCESASIYTFFFLFPYAYVRSTEYSSKSSSSSANNSGSATPLVTDGESTLFGSFRTTRSLQGAKEGSPSAETVSLQEKLQALLQERPPVLTRREQQVEFEQALTRQSTQFLKEASQQGKVKWQVYWKYLEAASLSGVFFYIFFIFAQQGFTLCAHPGSLIHHCPAVLTDHHSIVSNLVLRDWGEDNERTGRNNHPFEYLMWYGIWIVFATISSLASGILLWVYCSVKSAEYLHDSVCCRSPAEIRYSTHTLQMLHAVLKAPLGWFERTPMASHSLFPGMSPH